MNACGAEDHGEFRGSAARHIASDPDVIVAVLHGAGKAFSVGATYEWMDELTRDPQMLVELQGPGCASWCAAHIDLDKPVVAAVNGVANRLRSDVRAASSDYVIMEEQAKLADGHVRARAGGGPTAGTLIWPLATGNHACQALPADRRLDRGARGRAHRAGDRGS